jgi:hypothetical protein
MAMLTPLVVFETGMDLDEPLATAKKLFAARGGKAG